MDTLKRLHENISALADGELPDCEAELTLAALAGADGEAAWRAYHLVGDVLRADASGAELSEGFNARLTARLAAEPAPRPALAARGGAGRRGVSRSEPPPPTEVAAAASVVIVP